MGPRVPMLNPCREHAMARPFSQSASTGALSPAPFRTTEDSFERVNQSYEAGQKATVFLRRLKKAREEHARKVEEHRANPYELNLLRAALNETSVRQSSLGADSPGMVALLSSTLQ